MVREREITAGKSLIEAKAKIPNNTVISPKLYGNAITKNSKKEKKLIFL